MTVAPSGIATQPIGEAAPVAEGVWQLKLPVPFPLRFVSVYLVEGNDGWSILDAGYDYPPARAAWESGAAAVGCDLGRDVDRIVVTHFHPDHIGAARWLHERTGAPVCMMEREIPFARKLWGSSEVGPFVKVPDPARDAADGRRIYRRCGALPPAFAGGDSLNPPR